MKIRQLNHVQPTSANFAVIDWKRGEIILNLCFIEGAERNPSATVVHKVILGTENLSV